MAEDLQRRLHFGDSGLCLGAAAKLCSQILTQKGKINKSGTINSNSPQILELKVLWGECTAESDSVSVACSETLVSLVRNGHADFAYVMKGLLNVIPSAVNTKGPLQALGQLLVLEIQACVASEKVYHCPYGLRHPPHPFISSLTSRPDCWPTILQQVSKLLGITDDRYCCYIVPMLRPFLAYVLLNPTLPHQLATLRILLTDTLLQGGMSASPTPCRKDTVSIDICDFVLNCLRQVKITSLQELSEVNSQLTNLANFVLTRKAIDRQVMKSLSLVAFTLCKESLTFGQDVTPCLNVLDKMIESCGVDVLDETAICILSWMMLKVPVYQVKGLLSFTEKVLNVCELAAHAHDSSINMLVLPLLRVISTPVYDAVTMETAERSANQRRASQLLSTVGRLIQQKRIERTQSISPEKVPELTPSGWYQLMQSCCRLFSALINNPNTACEWLINLQSNVTSVGSVSAVTILLVSSLLWGQTQRVVVIALRVLISIASRDNIWAPALLPLLLYRLGRECDPVLTFDLLCAIPQTATHKVCVSGVVKALQSLTLRDEALSPLILRLTTQLWKLQDRSFPHLQKLLLQPLRDKQGFEGDANEMLLAQVGSIRDVCTLRPHRGADLLPALSKLLNDCTSEREASIAALALDALYSLCQAEVVDLRTMWVVLAPKLSNDKRPLVIQSLCKLLGSAPGLLAETQDYEDFCDDIVELLWQYSNHGNPIVSAAAFTALANFSDDDFTLGDIPLEVSEEERAKIESTKAKLKEAGDKKSRDEDGDEGDEDGDEYQAIPPSCYMKLLMHINPEALPAYQIFLSSLLVEEIKNLPRGVYKPAIRGQQQLSSKSKTFDSIPSLLLNRFERTKRPGLKSGLAVGLLCCFEPRREMSQRDDRSARRHIVNKSRSYQHIINTLMNEVCIECSNWFGCMVQPHAWMSLMQNAFNSLIQSRCAEFELQRSHGHLDESQADFQVRINSVWLWVRDKLSDQLKAAAKSTPLAQSNSILALASLAVVSTHHFLGLDDDDEIGPQRQSSQQHAGQNHWLAVIIDTFLCLLDSRYQTKAKIFTWYQQHPGGTLSTAAQSNAAIGISLLAPFLLTTNTQLLHHIMDVLTNGLPGQPITHPSRDVQMHYGIALGMLAARLHDEHYTDYLGTEGEIRMIRVVDALEASSLTRTENGASHGPLLGLAITLSAMSREGATHVKAHVASMHRKLVTRLVDEEDSLYVEALCMCIGCLTAAGFHSNIISPSDAFSVAVKLQTLCQQHDQNTGMAVCTGVLFHSLVSSSHSSINPLLTNLFSTWSSVIASQTTPVLQRTAAMYGLTGLVTGTSVLVQSGSQTQVTFEMHNKSMAVAKHLSQILSDWADPAIQNAASFLLGYLHLVSASASQIKTGIPSSYTYLPETSILRSCIDQLVLASKTGPEMMPANRLETLLSPLAGRQGVLPPLPPLNWTAVLSPIMRLPYGEEIQRLCLELAVSQMQRQSSSALFVTAWLCPALFTTLKESCKAVLYGSIPALIRAIPVSKLKPFIDTNLMESFRVFGMHTVDQCDVIMESLLAALRVPDPPRGVVVILRKAVRDVYSLMPASVQISHGSIMAKVAQCLCHLPGEDIDDITSPVVQNNLVKSTFVRSYIVCHGKQSLMWLNPCVDVAMNVADSDQHTSLVWTLLVALTHSISNPSQLTGSMPRMHWLLELMGHASNVAHSKTQLAPSRPIYKAIQFLLDVFTAAVIAWSSTDLPLILGIGPSWLPTDHHSEWLPVITSPESSTSFGSHQVDQHTVDDLLRLLPHSLPLLLDKEPWTQITDKVLDWLLGMHDVEHEKLSPKTKTHLKGTILSLRHMPAFKKPSCWARVHSL